MRPRSTYHERVGEQARAQHRRSPAGRRLGRLGAPVAFLAVGTPYVVALIRVLATAGARITLPDDLALIDLHVRRALSFRQQLGVFDHDGWNHPGPAYFYAQSVAYRLFGDRPASLFAGAVLLSGASALATLWVVRRRTSPTRTVIAAGALCWLGIILSAHSPSALTYSEGPLGGLASPWNPMVVVLPLLLLMVLSAAAVAGSGLSLLGAALVGSFVLQANISSGPLALLMIAVAGVGWVVTLIRRRGTERRISPASWLLGAAGGVLLVLVWLPPVVEQLSGHPGNMTLIARYFSSHNSGQPWSAAGWSVVDVGASLVVGPSQVMARVLGGRPPHALLGIVVLLGAVAAAGTAVVVGVRQDRRFAAGLGIAALVGVLGLLESFSRIVGFIFGYLVVWAVVVPLAAGLSVLLLGVPARWRTGHALRRGRLALLSLTVAGSLVFALVALGTPATSSASDPQVARLAAMVAAHLRPGQEVAVGDAGAGSSTTQLIDLERFIGLVNELDRQGYRPRVNHLWRAQFGPGYQSSGHEAASFVLTTWTPRSPTTPGYVGRVGDMALIDASAT